MPGLDFNENMSFEELCDSYIKRLRSIVEKAKEKDWKGFLHHGSSFRKITDAFIPLYSQKKPRPKVDENFEAAEREFKLGKKLYYQGNYREAAERFQRAASLVPQKHTYHGFLGLALKRIGSHDAAVKAFEKAISLYPLSRDYWMNLGECLREMGAKARAVEAFAIAYLVEPSDLEPIKRAEMLDPRVGISGKREKRGFLKRLFGLK